LSLIIQVAGYRLISFCWQLQLKRSVRRSFRSSRTEEQTDSFVFTNAQWKKYVEGADEDEFLYKGKMYDVIELKKDRNHVKITCITDEKETALIKKFNDLTRNDMGNRGSKTILQLFKLFSNPFIESGRLLLMPLATNNRVFQASYPQYISSTSLDVLTPPPQSQSIL
jgi:hypothetical protein